MLMIRLQRVGRKHEPVFRLVLTDSKNGPKSGKFLEIVGNFDARNSEKAQFNTEQIKHWMSKGAKLSETVHNLLIERKIIEGKKINNLPKKKPILSEKPAEEATAPAAPTASVEAVPETTSEPVAEIPIESASAEAATAEEPKADSAEGSQPSQDAPAGQAGEPKEEVAAEPAA